MLCHEQPEAQAGRQFGASPLKLGDADMSPASFGPSGLPMPDLSTSAAFPAMLKPPASSVLQQVHHACGLHALACSTVQVLVRCVDV
jgi:hypothetical protein